MQIGCVILAAGNARRFGQNKLLTLYEGRTLIRRAFDAVPAEGLGPVTVVTQYDAVAALAGDYGFGVVRNPAPERGISSSVALGAAAIGGDCAGLLFLAADQPLLRRETVAALADRFLADPTRIVVPTAEGRRGSPCVFPISLRGELLALTGDRGGSQVIRKHPELVDEFPVPARELLDVDTLEDLAGLQNGSCGAGAQSRN